MYKILLLIGTAFSLAFPALKLEIPECVKEIVANYAKNDTWEGSFSKIKPIFSNIDPSITLNEIEVEPPLKEYIIDYEKLDTCSVSIPIEELLRPTGRWVFPVKARGSYIYEVYIRYTKAGCIDGGAGSMHYELFWTSLRKQYPVSSGISPILVINGTEQYLHFPHKGPRSLYYLDPANFSGATKTATHDLSKENDCREIIKAMKKRYHEGKPLREEAEKKRPGMFKKMREKGGYE